MRNSVPIEEDNLRSLLHQRSSEHYAAKKWGLAMEDYFTLMGVGEPIQSFGYELANCLLEVWSPPRTVRETWWQTSQIAWRSSGRKGKLTNCGENCCRASQ